MNKIVLLTLGLLFSSHVSAEDVTQTIESKDIEWIRSHTSQHSTNGAGHTIIIKIQDFHPVCGKGVWIDSQQDPSTMSFILSGFMAGKSLGLRFNTNQGSPWGDPKWCALVHVDLTP